jgi:hypothetical protein
MKKPLLQTENRVYRTYRGGRLLDQFLGNPNPADSFLPEDWISSFVEAKNRVYRPGEGISRVMVDGEALPITEVITPADLGPGREDSGVLVKYLNAAERLGIQVHPTPDFSRKHFGTNYGKAECWHILAVEDGASIYIGFKEGITREKWKTLFETQDVEGMLSALHPFSVKPGDTVLVRAGTPHAIGAGCFLLEIQEPTDYTMRMEKITLAGEALTPMQIHYGVGEDAMLDCFIYEGRSEEEAYSEYFRSIIDNIKKFQNFDVYGHLDYVVRYGPNKDANYSYTKYRDLLDKILELLIDNGKGIEINTGGVCKDLRELHPCTDIIKRYRALGGEIITIGSDAHKPQNICGYFNRAEEVLKECGFKYYTIFEKRVPEFKKL